MLDFTYLALGGRGRGTGSNKAVFSIQAGRSRNEAGVCDLFPDVISLGWSRIVPEL